MIVSGAGALLLATWFGSTMQHYDYAAWRATYFCMAAVMGIGLAMTLILREPPTSGGVNTLRPVADNLRLLALFAVAVVVLIVVYRLLSGLPAASSVLDGFLRESLRLTSGLAAAALVGTVCVRAGLVSRELAWQTWLEPVADCFGLYRSTDIVSGAISNVFYQDLGYSKTEIASAVKVFGVVMTLVGGFLGGMLAQRYALMRMMMLGALLTVGTNLLFILLA